MNGVVFWEDVEDGVIHIGIVNEVNDKNWLYGYLSDICPEVHVRRRQLLPLYLKDN